MIRLTCTTPSGTTTWEFETAEEAVAFNNGTRVVTLDPATEAVDALHRAILAEERARRESGLDGRITDLLAREGPTSLSDIRGRVGGDPLDVDLELQTLISRGHVADVGGSYILTGEGWRVWGVRARDRAGVS